MPSVRLSHLSFSYSSAVPIISDSSFDLGPGWTGLVGANGAGKSTLLDLIAGSAAPDSGTVTIDPPGSHPVLCEQRVDALTLPITGFSEDWSGDAVRMRAKLALDPADIDRWETLSPGERKRWQVGAALVKQPDVLLLDEPTNHLDTEACGQLTTALEEFIGCGIVVSHDRRLLNSLTSKTVRIFNGEASLWSGKYDDARAGWRAQEREAAEGQEKLKTERKKLARRIDDQRRKSAQKDAERLRERRAAGKHDLDTRGSAATYKHERGQRTGAQTVSSMTKNLGDVDASLASAKTTKEKGGTVAFEFDPANKEFLIRYNGAVMAGQEVLFNADLAVRREDRIRISGRNGAGKTSLLRHLLDSLAIPADKVLHLAQETTAVDAVAWLDEVRQLPPDDRGSVMRIVAALGADPGTLLVSDLPSPGEIRKLALAIGLGTPKWLLALDEPTNHLDLPSIERLQTALSSFRGAILLITHDDVLAESITDTTWSVDSDGVSITS